MNSSGISDPASEGSGGPELLVVEDYADLAVMLQMCLETQGYTVRLASSITEALELYRIGETSLVLSDFTLPDGTAPELMRLLAPFGAVKAIALSGYDSPDCIQECRRAGFREYLVKPVEEHQLLSAVERVLGR